MNIDEAINILETECDNPKKGLPEKIFLFLTRLTPLINVDLLIKDDKGRTLLTWREDVYYGSGWHIPGGMVRFKESSDDRISAVADMELGCDLSSEDYPLAVNECIAENQINRSHSYSLLYRCKLNSSPLRELKYNGGKPQPGMYNYFNKTPKNILEVHRMYENYINN